MCVGAGRLPKPFGQNHQSREVTIALAPNIPISPVPRSRLAERGVSGGLAERGWSNRQVIYSRTTGSVKWNNLPQAIVDDVGSNLNRESYDAAAQQWDDARQLMSDSEKRIMDVLLQGVPSGANALDLGCGTGRPISEYLVSRELRVTGVDQSAAMLQLARSRMPEQRWILSSLESFEPEGEFVAVIAWDSLFHIPRDEHAAILERVRAVMPPGGRFALTVGGSEHPAFTDTMFGQTFFYDSHSPEPAMALLDGLRFRIILGEFLNLPTAGRDKGRFAMVAEAI